MQTGLFISRQGYQGIRSQQNYFINHEYIELTYRRKLNNLRVTWIMQI